MSRLFATGPWVNERASRHKNERHAPAEAIELIRSSKLFDASFYSKTSGVRGSEEELIRHYLSEGERKGLTPSRQFDVEFYKLANRDVATSGTSPLLHYVQYGLAEGRYPNAQALAFDVDRVKRSGLFDASFYSEASGVHGSEEELIRHYLSEGERKGLAPSRQFDVKFYKVANPDVATTGASPLLHYLQYGSAEGRYPNAQALAFDADRVKRSGLFDGELLAGIERHLAAWRFGLELKDFDGRFYASAYPDVLGSGKPPLLHYVDTGRFQRRVRSRDHLEILRHAIASHFDPNHYIRQAGAPAEADPVAHYLTVGRLSGFDPARDFSAEYYLRRYEDVVMDGAEPFLHYILYGKPEGRTGRPRFDERITPGAQRFVSSRPTIFIANHEASRTGAPLIGLELARSLSRTCNIITYTGNAGELVAEFASASLFTVVRLEHDLDAEFLLRQLRQEYDLSAAILNSVETAPFAKAALYAGVPSVALLHEFAEYTLPRGRAADVVAAVDRVIVPATIVLESFQQEVVRHYGARASNIIVRPQGWLPQLPVNQEGGDLTKAEILHRLKVRDAKPFIVLGVGAIHIRKGIELFVQTADEVRRRIGDDFRFVWVGEGYKPAADTAYSVWLQTAVERLGLQDQVVFFPAQRSISAFYEITDVFFLSSRLDPFPNVVLEALKAGKRIVCFQNASGSAELVLDGRARGAAVRYCDTAAAAEAIIAAARTGSSDDAEKNRALINEAFRFADYAAFLSQETERASASREQLHKTCERIQASGAFDADFHDGPAGAHFDSTRALRDYVARASKGLRKYNPRPGFSDGYYRSRHDLQEQEVPLEHALRSDAHGRAPATHRCVTLDARSSPTSFPAKIALHLHLHYAELAPEFVERLRRLKQPVDIFVTTTSSRKRVEVEYHFLAYEHGRVTVLEVENRGRDIGPFLTHLAEPLGQGGYDIIGHLHGKRSLAVDEAMGDRWRTYLLDTLLGPFFSELIHLFVEDPRLGLVFAEDRHAIGWDGNQELAGELAGKLNPPVRVPAFPPPFPLGTMFWARPAAVEPLWRMGIRVEDLPGEPVDYDGTLLHAIERTLPLICEATGLSWCTVYNRSCAW